MAMEIDEVIEEIESIVTVNTEKQAEALNWAVGYMKLLKSALNDYKDRKVEKVAMLTEIQSEIEEEAWKQGCDSNEDKEDEAYLIRNLIQEKINALKGE